MFKSLKIHIKTPNGFVLTDIDLGDIYIVEEQITGQALSEIYEDDEQTPTEFIPVLDLLKPVVCLKCGGLMSAKEPSDLEPFCNYCWKNNESKP